jgi:hypothetical protein
MEEVPLFMTSLNAIMASLETFKMWKAKRGIFLVEIKYYANQIGFLEYMSEIFNMQIECYREE